MPTHDDFLAAICAAPDDDVPRLVYADFLEECGEPHRAEFIRVQIQLARREAMKCERTGGILEGYAKFTPNCRCSLCKLKRREYLCSRRHIVWDWTAGLSHGMRISFRRGFVEIIDSDCDSWLRYGPDVLEAAPTVREVKISDRQPWANSTFASWANPAGWQERITWSLRESYNLPPVLVAKMSPPEWNDMHPDGRIACFRTKESAVAALSSACLAFARAELTRRRAAAPS